MDLKLEENLFRLFKNVLNIAVTNRRCLFTAELERTDVQMMEHAHVGARLKRKMVLAQRLTTLDTIYTNINNLGMIYVGFRILAALRYNIILVGMIYCEVHFNEFTK